MKLVLGKDFPAAPPQGYSESTLSVIIWASWVLAGNIRVCLLAMVQSSCVVCLELYYLPCSQNGPGMRLGLKLKSQCWPSSAINR